MNSPTNPTSIAAADLDAYAVILAHLQRFPEAQPDVLARFQRTAEEWAKLRGEAQKALQGAAQRKDTALLARFAKANGEARSRIGDKPLHEALGRPAARPPAPAPAPAPTPTPAPTPSPLPPPSPPPPSFSPLPPPPSAAWTPAPISLLPAIAGQPRLSLNQYASMRADLITAPPGEIADVRARYGLDEPGDIVEAGAWRSKFAESPELFDRYKSMFQYFRALAGAQT